MVRTVQAVEQSKKEGGELVYGGKVINRPGYFVEPALILSKHDAPSL